MLGLVDTTFRKAGSLRIDAGSRRRCAPKPANTSVTPESPLTGRKQLAWSGLTLSAPEQFCAGHVARPDPDHVAMPFCAHATKSTGDISVHRKM